MIIALRSHTAMLVVVLIIKYDFISSCICPKTLKKVDFSQPVIRASLDLNDLLSSNINIVKNRIIPVFFTIVVIAVAAPEISEVKFIFAIT